MSAKILIVEDNVANHELVQYLLKSAGYETISAWDGNDGLNKTLEFHPDLILCDLQMPVMNGYELVSYLKKDPLLKKIPVIAVTASSMAGDSDKVVAAGFNGYISKPINPQLFIKQIEDYLPVKQGD